jgi:hypothetical protein
VKAPRADTFRMVLAVLEKCRKEDPENWRINNQYICFALADLSDGKAISRTEYLRGESYIGRCLEDTGTLSCWLSSKGHRQAHFDISRVNDHRIEWLKRIIDEVPQ